MLDLAIATVVIDSAMHRSRILGIGMSVPPRVVTNHELATMMETSNEWIIERTGIEERRWVAPGETGATLATAASQEAIRRAGIDAKDIDLIISATLSPDFNFPGTGVFVQRALGLKDIPCLDIRQQCTGFIYGLSIADAYIRTGAFKHVLLIGSEVHSTGLDISTRGRDVAVLFGDGGGAAIVGPASDDGRGILSAHLYADGTFAEDLWVEVPSSLKHPRLSHEDLDAGRHYPRMNGRMVFKHAVLRVQELVLETLSANGYALEDLGCLIPHQANLRISEFVQRSLGLRDEQIHNNIDRYGNTTAASIPLCLDEAVRIGKVRRGDLVCLVAFGAGFTWGSVLLRW